jgi:hypothetical protein
MSRVRFSDARDRHRDNRDCRRKFSVCGRQIGTSRSITTDGPHTAGECALVDTHREFNSSDFARRPLLQLAWRVSCDPVHKIPRAIRCSVGHSRRIRGQTTCKGNQTI